MKHLYLSLLLISNISFCQINNGIIEYGLNFGTDEKLENNSVLKDYYRSAVSNAKYLTFKLSFTRDIGKFIVNESLASDETGLNMTKAFSNLKGTVFYSPEAIIYETETHFGKFVVSKPSDNWTHVNETKVIDTYQCYKATTEYIVVNEKGTFKYPVIAWYCPKIPFSFGPNGYGGLPGMILELQVKNVVFGATLIKLNTNESIDLKKIDDTKVITEKEFEDIIRIKSNEMFDSKD